MSRADELWRKADGASLRSMDSQDGGDLVSASSDALRSALYRCTAALIETIEERFPNERERAELAALTGHCANPDEAFVSISSEALSLMSIDQANALLAARNAAMEAN